MADRPKVGCESFLQDCGAGSVAFIRIPQISQNDTVTLSDFSTLTSVTGIRADTLATVNFSVATNVATLTSSVPVNTKVYILAVGTR